MKITIKKLNPVPSRNGLDFHLDRINARLPGDVLEVVNNYLLEQKSRSDLKPQSLRSIAFGVKASMVLELGHKYHTDPRIKFAVDGMIKQFTKVKRQLFVIKREIDIKDLLRFVTMAGDRAALIAEFLFSSGMRISEMCGIRTHECKPVANHKGIVEHYEVIIHGKGGVDRLNLFLPELIERVQQIFRGKLYLFESENGLRYERRGVAALLREQSLRHLGYSLTPHMLRTLFATWMSAHRPDLQEVVLKHMGTSAAVKRKHYDMNRLHPKFLPRLRSKIA